MALKLWLPLNGNFDNKGIYRLPEHHTGEINWTTGKICHQAYQGYYRYVLQDDNLIKNKWTVAFWVEPLALTSAANVILFCKNTTGATGDCQIYMSLYNKGAYLRLGVNGNTDDISYSYQFEIDKWYHIAATFDGETAKLYLNGENVDSTTIANDYYANRNNIRFNGRATNADGTTGTGSFSSVYQDCRIYDEPLSDAEIHQLTQGLAVHHKLDGNGYFDSSGFSVNGEILDSVSFVDSPRYGQACQFDNNKSGIYMNSFPSEIFNMAHTVAFWVKPDSSMDKTQCIYCGSFTGASSSVAYNIGHNSSNKLRLYWNDSPAMEYASFSIEMDVWQHIAITRTEEGKMKCYKNGELIGTLIGPFNAQTWDTKYYLGRDARGNSKSLIGAMSDYRLYATPLTDDDIRLLYERGARVDNVNGMAAFELKENGAPNIFNSAFITNAQKNLTTPTQNWDKTHGGLLYFDVNNTSSGSKKIPIEPNTKYIYDVIFDNTASNSAKIYIWHWETEAQTTWNGNGIIPSQYSESSEDITDARRTGSFNTGSDYNYMGISAINGTTSQETNGIFNIKRFVFKKDTEKIKPSITKTGTLVANDLNEYKYARFYETYTAEAAKYTEM